MVQREKSKYFEMNSSANYFKFVIRFVYFIISHTNFITIESISVLVWQ